MKDAYLVYQVGIANVFIEEPGSGELVRRYQGDYRGAEMLAKGMELAGVRIHLYHCDEAGDIRCRDWNEGPGDLWSEGKHFAV